MPTLDQLAQALKAADAAGNTDDARRLAQAYAQMRDAGPDFSNVQGGAETQQHEAPGLVDELRRSFTMAGRNVAHGAASLGGLVIDPISYGVNKVEAAVGAPESWRIPTTAQSVDAALNAAGVPQYEPQNATERVVGGIERGIGGLASGMGLGSGLASMSSVPARAIGTALKSSPRAQLAAAVTGTGASEASRELGAPPLAQVGFGVLGGMVPAGVGAGGAGLLASARRALGAPSEEAAALGRAATNAGIPLKTSQVSPSRVAKLMDSVTGQVPFSGAQKFQELQQQAFNRAVGRTIGADSNAITSDVFAKAKSAIGRSFDQLTSRNNLAITPGVSANVRNIVQDAMGTGDETSIRALRTVVQRIAAQAQNGVLPGRAYQSIDSMLGQMSTRGGDRGHFAGQLREALRDGMDASITPADQAAWQEARRQYRDLKTLEPLIAKDSVEGNVSPAQLLGRVNANNAGKAAMASGRRGDLGELAAIGQRFVKNTVPDSGTAQRSALFNALRGLGPVAGGGLGYAAGSSPLLALLGAAGTVGTSRVVQNTLRNEALVNALLGRAPAQNRLLQGFGASLNPTTQNLLEGNQR